MADGTARGIEAAAAPLWRRLEIARPNRSARRVATYVQFGAFGLLAGALANIAMHFPAGTATALYAAVYAFFVVAILLRLFAASAALARAPERIPEATETPVYTVLCPLRHEAAVVADLADALAWLNYPGLMAQTPPRAGSAHGLNRPTLGRWNTGPSRR